MKRFIIRVFGKVQGVWFRKSTQQKAQELGLVGFVKNQPDGSVYLEAQGDVEKLWKLTTWCKKGPELADVTDIKISEESLADYEGFEIRH